MNTLRLACLLAFTALLAPPAAAAPGDVDGLDLNLVGTNVQVAAVQPDGKTIIGGAFNMVLGQPRVNIARINADGTLDMGFDPNPNGDIRAVVVQPDGKLLLCGNFTALQPNGAPSPTTRNRVARVNEDGTLDMGFDPNADGVVECLALQADGQILISGQFTALQPNGAPTPTTRNRIARLNPDGTVEAGFDPNAGGGGNVVTMAVQADGAIVLGGTFTTLQPNGAPSPTTRTRVARVNADGTLDAGFDPTVDGTVVCLVVQPDGKVLIAGQFTALQPNGEPSPTPRRGIARVNVDGTLDVDFDPKPDGNLRAVTLQTDGKMLLVGVFTTLQPNGAAAPSARSRIARVHADGTLDEDFDPNPDNAVSIASLRPDGAVLLGGQFGSLQPNGAVSPTTRNRFARLENDPASQTVSAPDATRALWTRRGAGPELTRAAFELSTDGGANWTLLGEASRVGATADWELTGLTLPVGGQLRARGYTTGHHGATYGLIEQVAAYGAGTLDPLDVNPGGGLIVFATVQQPDGKVIIGGDFTSVLGVPRNGIARLNADGTLDMGFDPNPDGEVYCVAVQRDGKVVIGGFFSTLQPNGAASPTPRSRIARVDENGNLDTGFDPKAGGIVSCVAVQADGKVLLGGTFTTLQPNGAGAPTARGRIARVNADGTLDTGFAPTANGEVRSVAVQADGKVLLGGEFTTLQPNGAGVPEARNLFARLNNDAATQTLFAVDATQVAWQRGGAGPELARVAFELSTDGGANWSLLGEGSRIGTTPDWQLDGIGLPLSGLVRARGTTVAGNSSGSSGLIEQVAAFEVAGTIGGTGGMVTGGDLPAGTTVASFTSADIGVSGGRVLRPDGRKVDAVFNENGQVLLHGGQMVPVDPAGGGAMGMIATFKAPTGDAVLAKLDRRSGATPGDDEVIFVGLQSGTPTVIARKGQLLVGLDDVRIKSFLTLDGNGTTTFFSGKLAGKGVTGGNSTAIFAAKRPGGSLGLPEAGAGAGAVKVLVRKGDIVDGRMVRTVATLVGQAKTLAEGRWRGGPDSLGVRLTFTDRAQALYLMPGDAASPADWLLLGKTFDDAQPDLPGAMLQSFMLPAYAPDATVFDSLLRVGPGGITRKNNRAVFDAQGAGMGGPITRRVLAQRAGPAPSTAGAPVGGSAMARFLATLAGAGRASAFLASSTLPGVRGARDTIYDARFDGQLSQVARLGEAAPGGGRFARFVSVAKPNGTGYGALVSALLGVSPADGVTPGNRAALFVRDSAGDMQRLLRTGDMLVSAGPGSPMKTVRSFVALQAAAGSIGAARGYDDDGRVNVLATFTDRTQAVVRIQVP